MKYTVLWTPTAQEDLAAIWIDAEDRAAVTSAANTLGIDFEVLDEDCIVYVLTVWHIGKGKSN